jgi:hypothetical protein
MELTMPLRRLWVTLFVAVALLASATAGGACALLCEAGICPSCAPSAEAPACCDDSDDRHRECCEERDPAFFVAAWSKVDAWKFATLAAPAVLPPALDVADAAAPTVRRERASGIDPPPHPPERIRCARGPPCLA